MTRFVITLALLACGELVAAPPDGERAYELESLVLQERLKLQSGELVIRNLHVSPLQTKQSEYRLTFDGPNLRNFVTMSLNVQFSTGEQRYQPGRYKFAFTPELVLFHMDQQSEGTPLVAAAAYHLGTKDPRTITSADANRPYKMDPRKFGLLTLPMGLYHTRSLEDALAVRLWQETTVEQELHADEVCWRVRHISAKGALLSLLIAPERGHSVLEAVWETDRAFEQPVLNTVVNQVQQYGTEGIWFPYTSRYTRKLGDKVVISESYEVVRAEFNIPIPAETFALAGLELPVGTMVYESPPRRVPTQQYWDGEKLVSDHELPGRQGAQVKPELQPLAEVSSSGTRWWLLLLANLFVLLTIGLLAVRHHLLCKQQG